MGERVKNGLNEKKWAKNCKNKAKFGGSKFQKIQYTCQFKLLNVKEVLEI